METYALALSRPSQGVLAFLLVFIQEHYLAVLVGLITFSITTLIIHSRNAKLDHIPGPFLARYTNLYSLYKSWKSGQDTDFLHHLHRRYGDVVRTAPRMVSVADPEAVELIYGLKARLSKDATINAALPAGSPQVLATIRDPDEHMFHRRIVQQAYTLSSLLGYEDRVDELLGKLLVILDKFAIQGEKVDIARWSYFYSYDLIGYLSFGDTIGFMNSGKDMHYLIKFQIFLLHYIRLIMQMPWLHILLLGNPVLGVINAFFTPKSAFMKVARAQINDRMRRKDNGSVSKPDMLAYFISAKEKYPETVTDDYILNLAALNIGGGTITTSKVMEKIFNYLTAEPEYQEKIFQAMKAAKCQFPISWEQIQNVPYLQAVFKEGVRLHLSGNVILSREVPEAGLELPDGTQLPSGVSVGMKAYVVSLREDVVGKDPEKFVPERWLRKEGETEEEFKARCQLMNRGNIHFGYGARTCLGKNITKFMICKSLATLVWKYKMAKVDNRKPQNTRSVWVKLEQRG